MGEAERHGAAERGDERLRELVEVVEAVWPVLRDPGRSRGDAAVQGAKLRRAAEKARAALATPPEQPSQPILSGVCKKGEHERCELDGRECDCACHTVAVLNQEGERDREISKGGDRDLGSLAVRGEWDDADHLCQTYLREAAADIAAGTVTDFVPAERSREAEQVTPEEIEAIDEAISLGTAELRMSEPKVAEAESGWAKLRAALSNTAEGEGEGG